MPILENMTVSEKHNYERMKKRGYTDEEIKQTLLGMRNIPLQLKEKAIQAIEKKLIVKFPKEETKIISENSSDNLEERKLTPGEGAKMLQEAETAAERYEQYMRQRMKTEEERF